MNKQSLPTIGQAIKLYRADLDISQEELSNRVRCSRFNITNIEGGHTNPGFRLAYRISRTLGFSLDSVVPNETHAEQD